MSDTAPHPERWIAISVGDDGFSWAIARGAVEYATDRPHWRIARENVVPVMASSALKDWRGDGVIGRFASAQDARLLMERGIRVVNVSHLHQCPGVPTVGADDLAIGRLGAEHLLGRGFANLGFCGFAAHWYSDRRERGFVEAVHRAGAEAHVWRAPEDWALSGDEGHQSVIRWLSGLPRPVAVMACNDVRARHVVEFCLGLGYRVPQDVAVLGVDDDEWQTLLARTPISSIDPNARLIGQTAARLLDQLMQGPTPETTFIDVPPRGVIVRQSTDMIASSDLLVARAAEYVRQHLTRDVRVEDLVKALGVSRRSLEVRVRKSLGWSPQQLIWQSRVDLARTLLLQRDLLLKDVVRRCGFVNQTRFNVVFKRVSGMTPGAYRAAYARR